MSTISQIDTLFSGITSTSSYPPHNGLAVGPGYIVMAEGSRIEWTNLTGGAATVQSVYSFFNSLGATATNSLYDPRVIFDATSGRFIIIMENIGSNGAVSNIDIAVSKDSNPNDGWYFASLNTSLTINGQLTSSDRSTISVDANNIYITAPQYNVNVPGFAGTETWVIGKTAGAGGGLYSGGTLTVVSNQITPSSQGIFAAVAGNNGKTYYACDYSTGSQIVVAVQAFDTATS
ncbi:MAG: phosphoesterase, partial [Bradyrhizobium sp.]